MPQKIEITTANIFGIVIILFVLLFVFLIRDVVLLFFTALIIAAAFNPLVNGLKQKKIPRPLSTGLIFLTGLGLFAFVIYLIVPPLIEQIGALAANLPYYIQKLPFEFKTDYLQDFLKSIGNYLAGVPAGVSSVIVTLILAFYLLVQKQGPDQLIKTFTPAKHQEYALNLSQRIQKKMGYWLLGQLTSCLFVGILTFIGLYFLKVPYALILAMAVGIAEIIPFGPLVAFIPAGILGFLQSPLTGVLVVALYLVIQQFEGHIIVPQIMKKAVGLNPVTVILAILIGAKLAGILGLLIAIPTAAAFSVLIKDFMSKRKKYAGQ